MIFTYLFIFQSHIKTPNQRKNSKKPHWLHVSAWQAARLLKNEVAIQKRRLQQLCLHSGYSGCMCDGGDAHRKCRPRGLTRWSAVSAAPPAADDSSSNSNSTDLEAAVEKKRESTTAGFSSDLLRCRPVAAGDKVCRWRLAWQEDNARLMGTLGRKGGWRVGRGRREDMCGAVVNIKKTTANKTSRRVLPFP